MSYAIGSAKVECPACGQVIDVPVTAEMTQQGDRQYLACEPDMADLWAHAWTHGMEGKGNYGDEEKPQ